MIYGVLGLIIALLLIGYIYEKRESIAVMRAAKRYREERDDERKWGDKMLFERNDAIKRCIELEKKSVAYVFSDWECIKDVTGVRDYYLEKEGMRIIVEDGKATSGFYSKEGPGEYIKPVAKVVEGSKV
ncbi:MAG: hypothetical protein IJA60_02650 [Clostridia bacterium]|nr:hypothetical protein [Clostridia bacterium]